MRVLLIEDETGLRTALQAALQSVGADVMMSADGLEGHYLASEYPFDVVVIDLGLPGLPGLEVIERLRSAGSTVPILILTARGRWQDKVEGLERGADDYLTKPFEVPELLARVKALWRRTASFASARLSAGPYRIDLDAQQIWCDQAQLELTPFEFRLLAYLVRHRERVVTRQELSDYLYPLEADRESNVIEVLIGRLRRKIDPAGQWHPLETVRGRGYRFVLSCA